MRRRAVLAASVALLALVSCGNDADTADQHRHAHTHLDTSDGKPDRVIAGPQGGRGQFVVECGFSHVATDDPIVHPGQPGASHEHVFFGNTTTDAASTWCCSTWAAPPATNNSTGLRTGRLRCTTAPRWWSR